ncbi:MAG: hypothetical protein ACREIM_08015 [Nitrospiraceae bacterium]
MTPAEAADALFAVIPRAISRDLLADYGIEGSEVQARDVTREVLSLNLYWISAAIEAHIPRDYRTVLFDRLLQLVSQEWASQFQQSHVTWTEYLEELEQRRMVYVPIGRAKGGEIGVATQAGAILEDNRIVRDEDRSKVLALLLDLIPLDRYGAILDEGF